MSNTSGPTLTDARGMGGIIALDGFDYQVWDALVRLPLWVRNPSFEGMAVEMLEDVEARFFAPHSPHGHILERFQAKSGTLTPAEIKRIIESFAAFEAAHPHVARVQTLVTPALPSSLRWIARDVGRVRRARPFYSPFSDIRKASDDKLRADLVEEFGPELGNFFAEAVEVGLRIIPDRANAEVAFAAALGETFPDVDCSARKVQAVFSALNDLVVQSRGVMLTRQRLLAVLCEVLEFDLIPDQRLHIHIRSDRNGSKADAIEIDASRFAGGGGGFPASQRWIDELFAPIEATARWAREHNFDRIALSGLYRLSTAFILGFAFRSTAGFEIDVATRSGWWMTDEIAGSGTSCPACVVSEPQVLASDRLAVSVGILRDPAPYIREGLSLSDGAGLLTVILDRPLTDGADAQALVAVVKNAVAKVVAKFRPANIDLYYLGPSALGVMLGHRWNALPPTQLYEFAAGDQSYKPTACIG